MGVTSACLWVLTICLIVQSQGPSFEANDGSTVIVNVGVVVDPNTRIGKEQRVGVEVAAEEFNNPSHNVKVVLHFANSNSSNPLQAAYSARRLVEERKVKAIIGAETWQEATLLGQLGNQYKVPVLSLAAAPNSLPVASNKSFLVQMTSNYTAQISCIASLVSYYGWQRVVVAYEDGGYDDIISSMLDLLSQSLQDVGSQIEYRLALPVLSFMTNPKDMIIDELAKVSSTQSRVFVVLHSSVQLASHLFKEAKIMGLGGRDTAWIVTDSIADLLDSLNSSIISDMEGTLGVKRYYDEYSQNFKKFSERFLLKYLSENPDEVLNSQPGIHALRAYDAMTTIEKALNGVTNITSPGDALLQGILSSRFTGLSGNISIKNGVSEKDGTLFRLVNVVGKKYKELDYWSVGKGFFEKLQDSGKYGYNQVIHGSVNWPGDVNHIPKGWAMPTSARPLKIGVPGKTTFDKFVKVENFSNPNRTSYSGYCIDIFLEVVKIIEESYALPYEFEAFNGTYDELVNHVRDKTYDAAVGDVTILANRSKYVEFTQPFTKSGLSMVVPFKSKEFQKTFMFIRPFSLQLWVSTAFILLYTMLAIFLIEKQITNNPDFGGPWTNQFNVSLWFTFSSVFHTQRENIKSTFTRIIVVIWFFVAFVLTQSYTASLTSILTVPLLEPNLKDIYQLQNTNSTIGCDGDSFVWDYLVNVLKFRPDNIKNVSNEYDYPQYFANGSIVAALLELPYQKVFLDQYCENYTHTGETFRFEGQGFVFQKGSPLVNDVSKAILNLSENGVLKSLNDKWFPVLTICSSKDNNVERLKPQVFIALYAAYGAITILCFLFFVAPYVRSYIRNYGSDVVTLGDRSFWNWMTSFALYIQRGSIQTSDAVYNDRTQRDDRALVVQNQAEQQTLDRPLSNA